jgi:hypothetical protein
MDVWHGEYLDRLLRKRLVFVTATPEVLELDTASKGAC